MSSIAPVRFRLYPEPARSLYAAVIVWPTKTAMRRAVSAYARQLGQSPAQHRNTGGYCAGFKVRQYPKGKRMRTLPIFAEVHLFAGDGLAMRIITHELFHATAEFGRRIRFDFRRLDAEDSVNDDEERLAYAHSELCRQFMIRANALGLYGKT